MQNASRPRIGLRPSLGAKPTPAPTWERDASGSAREANGPVLICINEQKTFARFVF
jgi:hypothetical protein